MSQDLRILANHLWAVSMVVRLVVMVGALQLVATTHVEPIVSIHAPEDATDRAKEFVWAHVMALVNMGTCTNFALYVRTSHT